MADTFVVADDGLFYRDPVIASPLKSLVADWFICFDGPLQPTMVLRVPRGDYSQARIRASRLLREAGLQGRVGLVDSIRLRTFPPRWDRAFHSVTFRVSLTGPVPASHVIQHGGTLSDASLPGTYYDFGGA